MNGSSKVTDLLNVFCFVELFIGIVIIDDSIPVCLSHHETHVPLPLLITLSFYICPSHLPPNTTITYRAKTLIKELKFMVVLSLALTCFLPSLLVAFRS